MQAVANVAFVVTKSCFDMSYDTKKSGICTQQRLRSDQPGQLTSLIRALG